jgi:hypothetical protein
MSVYFNVNVFGTQTGRQKNLDPMTAGIAGVLPALGFFMNAILICLGLFTII